MTRFLPEIHFNLFSSCGTSSNCPAINSPNYRICTVIEGVSGAGPTVKCRTSIQ